MIRESFEVGRFDASLPYQLVSQPDLQVGVFEARPGPVVESLPTQKDVNTWRNALLGRGMFREAAIIELLLADMSASDIVRLSRDDFKKRRDGSLVVSVTKRGEAQPLVISGRGASIVEAYRKYRLQEGILFTRFRYSFKTRTVLNTGEQLTRPGINTRLEELQKYGILSFPQKIYPELLRRTGRSLKAQKTETSSTD